MNKSSYKLSIIFSSLLLLICCITSTYAQLAKSKKAETFNRAVIEAGVEPRGSVRVNIKYKKEYGYKSDSKETGPTSGQVFSVFAKQYPSGRQDRPYTVTAEPKMRESDASMSASTWSMTCRSISQFKLPRVLAERGARDRSLAGWESIATARRLAARDHLVDDQS